MQRGSGQTGRRLGAVVQKIRKYEIDSDRPNFHESMYICTVYMCCRYLVCRRRMETHTERAVLGNQY